MKLKAKLTIYDTKTGKIELEQESKSWVIQFLQLLSGMWQYSNSGITLTGYQIKDTGGTLRTFAQPALNSARLYMFSQVTVTTHGIVCGSGVGAESPTDFQLGTIIAQGLAANTLNYGNHVQNEPMIAGTVMSFDLERTVMNGSGGAIDVNEVGIYVWQDLNGTGRYFMIIRDKLGSALTIADGGNKTIKYTISADNSG